MSRLYDRILAYGCERLRPYHLAPPGNEAERLKGRAAEFERHRDEFTTEEEFEAARQYAMSHQAQVSHQPIAGEKLDSELLEGMPVIVADDVAAYCHELPVGTDLKDLVTTAMAPPFDRFFVEMEALNDRGLNAWGVLVEDITESIAGDWDRESIGWHLMFTLVIEPKKNAPVGPVARFLAALDPEGLWAADGEDGLVWAGGLVDFEPEMPKDIAQAEADQLVPLMAPALMAIAFTHCRNVTADPVDPPEKLSKKWERRRGRPLSRYHVLEIAPMRAVLDSEGDAHKRGLGHALHVCRGHFKRFSEDAPLFGRVTGTFWWAPHVRGDSQHGTVEKDYRVSLDRPEVGRRYEKADEDAEVGSRGPAGGDPDAAGRGLRAHNVTQNRLAAAVEEAGYRPRAPKPDEPNYDLAWDRTGVTVVAEVKSLTDDNEERQLRLAIGQVVRYRFKLAEGGCEVEAMIAVERPPTDPTWLELCSQQGIVLAWPELFEQAVAGV